MPGESLPYRAAADGPDGTTELGLVWAPSLAAALPHLVAALPGDAWAVVVAVDQAEVARVAEARRAREADDGELQADAELELE